MDEILVGTRWRNKRSKRIACVVSVTETQVLYRYDKREGAFISTCNVKPEGFIRSFAPILVKSE